MPYDVVSLGETMLRLNAPNNVRLEQAETLRIYVAGSESNTLACLSRLNLKTAWISALPKNPLGQRVETELRGHGIDTRHIIWSRSNTRLGIFYSEESPEPLGLQVYYDRANSALALLEPGEIDASVIDGAKLLHLTGITPALSECTKEIFSRFLHRARDKGVPLSFDVNYRAKLWPAEKAAADIDEACQQANLLFCTQTDAADLWGFTGSPDAVLHQMAGKLASNNPSKTLVLTLGSEGSAQLQGDIYTFEPAIPSQGAARFGSGDAFAAGYIYTYLNGQLYREMHAEQGITALTFGNALAALKRCIAGDIAIITPDEVRAVLQKRGRNTRFR